VVQWEGNGENILSGEQDGSKLLTKHLFVKREKSERGMGI
jgi:hypothetical protein